MSQRGEVIAFLGPSLSHRDARRVAPGVKLLPPARQGDVFRVLPRAPRAIALVDGVFEASPSVWHRELLAALDAGVAVFGGSSMGALRAAELGRYGVVGVGQIARWYANGELNDDSDVALLHADAAHAFRPLTVPLVNVVHAAYVARTRKVLTRRAAEALVEAARSIHYQERTWPRVLSVVAWRPQARAAWAAFARAGLPDLKRDDAIATLQAAAAFARSGAQPPPGPGYAASALVRGRRLRQASGWRAEVETPGEELLRRLELRADAGELAEAGLRRLLLAGWARTMGLRAGRAEVEAEREAWRRALGLGTAAFARYLKVNAIAADDAVRLLEDRVLERRLLENASRVLADGPSWLEGLVSEARRRGL